MGCMNLRSACPLSSPANVGTGGPGGVGDAFLQLTALGGNGPASKLTVLNPAQWAGDYLAAGIGAIGMDVNNPSSSDLYLRFLAFEDPMGGAPANIAFSTDPIVVAANSGWTHAVFRIRPADLTAGLGSVGAALGNTTVLRFYHSTAANFPPLRSTRGDSAAWRGQHPALAPVPEPMTSLLVGSGLAALLAKIGERGHYRSLKPGMQEPASFNSRSRRCATGSRWFSRRSSSALLMLAGKVQFRAVRTGETTTAAPRRGTARCRR